MDRLFRNLLIDASGNTHRAEFCIDKLFPPESAGGRLGLLELRAFEMPPHARMSAAQQLLLRGLIARFWRQPYTNRLVRWGTDIHDRWMLPHFCETDFTDVIADLRQDGQPFEAEWFAPHFEFRFPRIGQFVQRDVPVELRAALEPWHVLGEEAGRGRDRSLCGQLARTPPSQGRRHGRRPLCHHLQWPARAAASHRNQRRVCGRRPLPRLASAGMPSAQHRRPHSAGVGSVRHLERAFLGGCTYHVAHPGGRNYTTFPINAYEAEAGGCPAFSRTATNRAVSSRRRNRSTATSPSHSICASLPRPPVATLRERR